MPAVPFQRENTAVGVTKQGEYDNRRAVPNAEFYRILVDCRDLTAHRLLVSFTSMMDRIADGLFERANHSGILSETTLLLETRSIIQSNRAYIVNAFEKGLRVRIDRRLRGEPEPQPAAPDEEAALETYARLHDWHLAAESELANQVNSLKGATLSEQDRSVQYNLLSRTRVEEEYARLYDDIGLGTTIWSPLASGLLTGKYRDGVPDDSRGALPGYEWLADRLTDAESLAKVERLRPIAADLDCSMAQLAIAWCAANPRVSTVITGASRPSQVVENFAAIDVLPLLTAEVMERIAAAIA